MAENILIEEEDDADFYNAVAAGDDLIGVIRAAIHIENQLIRIIEALVVDRTAINRMKLTYDNKVNLAIGLGLNDGCRKALNSLGTVRNKFAHRLNAVLADGDANNLYDSLGETEKTILQNVYQRMLQAGVKQPSRMSSLPVRLRFALYVTTLRSAIIFERRRLTGR